MDLFSRKIVGWAVAPTIGRGLVLDAVLMAVRRRRPKKAIIHSDQGSQNGSDDWRRFCRTNGLIPSMSRRGPPSVGPFEQPLHIFGGEQRYAFLGECADHDVVTIWIPERKLLCSCGGIHVRLLVESGYKSAGPMECQVEIIDTEKQK
jgi:hypothetical protein